MHVLKESTNKKGLQQFVTVKGFSEHIGRSLEIKTF